jgi:acetyl esterase/lipase
MVIESSRHWLDLDYVGDGHIAHRLDIHLPTAERARYPVVITIYGSAWLSDSWKAHTYRTGVGQALLESGFAVVSINYRTSGEVQFPGQLHDVKAAIRFVRANAAAFSLDTTFIGVTGWSSGGHLAAMAGTTSGLRTFEKEGKTIDLEGDLGEHIGSGSHVDAVVDWFGPTDFLIMDKCGSAMHHDAADSPESALVGGPIQEHPLACALADPATYVQRDNPPFLLLHGDADPLVPHCQSEHLLEKLQDQDVESELVVIPGGKHGPGVLIDEYFQRMVSFFSERSE